jgi:ribulose-5-phosphate 4-epimerase/fuculose-1-phosphate aldolase
MLSSDREECLRRFRLVKSVILEFIVKNEQQGYWFKAENNVTLETDGHTIWLVKPDGTRFESITMAHAVDVWVADGNVEEIPVNGVTNGT